MISLLKRALSDRKILRAAICSAPVPIAIYNDDDILIAWSPGYEQLHTQAFSDRRACAEAGNLTYRDIMRYQIDSRLGTDDAEAELDRLVSISPSAMKIDQRIVLPGPHSEKIQKLIQAIVDIGSVKSMFQSRFLYDWIYTVLQIRLTSAFLKQCFDTAFIYGFFITVKGCLLYTSPSPRDRG